MTFLLILSLENSNGNSTVYNGGHNFTMTIGSTEDFGVRNMRLNESINAAFSYFTYK